MRKQMVIHLVVIVMMVLCLSYETQAADVSEKEWGTIEHCLGIIRNCQMDDGMIRMKGNGDPVWTVPYFSNFAAMALLAAHEVRPNPKDLERVERWLGWYACNQEADGTIYDRSGSVSSYKSNGRRDSTDSYAATFLMTAWRYKRACNKRPSDEIVNAARKAVTAIDAVMQADGLTIAKPDYAIKYLMDNIEVYQGLMEGALFFDSVDMKEEAQKARRMASRTAESLGKFWSEQDQHFANAIDRKGKLFVGLLKPYPDGLAQLFGLAHITPKRPGLWKEINKKFKPGDQGMPVERWLIAANGMGDDGKEEKEKLRKATVEAALLFTSKNVYVQQPAMTVIALIDGKSRFPEVPLARTNVTTE